MNPSKILPPVVYPNDPPMSYHVGQGLEFHKAGNLQLAQAAYRAALLENAGDLQALSYLANISVCMSSYQQAIEMVENVLKSAPYLCEARFVFAAALIGLGHKHSAISYLTQASVLGHEQAADWLERLLKQLGTKSRIASMRQRANLLLSLNSPIASFNTTLDLLDLEPDNDINWLPFGRSLSMIKWNSRMDERVCLRIQQAFQRDSTNYQELSYATVSGLRHEDVLVDFFSAEIAEKSLERFILNRDGNSGGLSHPLLNLLLQKAMITDYDFEARLTVLRKILLNLAASDKESIPVEIYHFIASLSIQCFLNEYIYNVSQFEREQLNELKQTFREQVVRGTSIDSVLVAVLASYEALYLQNILRELPCNHSWPEWISPVIRWQLIEPLGEQALSENIPQLSPIKDQVSGLVQSQYEENPFPRWISIGSSLLSEQPSTLTDRVKLRFPWLDIGGEVDSKNPEVLVAGCGTGVIPNVLVRQIKNARITAVDLSRASLAYSIRKSNELGHSGISYLQADILDLPLLDIKFDYINCYGVLHHMKNILDGWSSLLSVLKPGGVMQIGLYSKTARKNVTRTREYIREYGFKANAEEMRLCRQAMINDREDELIASIVNTPDFYSMSNFRDLVFHCQEHQVSIPEIESMLKYLGLEFIGFELDEPAYAVRYAALFPQDPNRVNLECWDQFERKHPQIFANCYNFWVRKTV